MIDKVKTMLKRLFGGAPKVPSVYNKYTHSEMMNIKPQFKKYDIGDFTYGIPVIVDYSVYDDIASQPTKLKIGKFCSLADIKILLGGNHRVDWISTYPFNALNPKFRYIKGHPATKGDVVIGNDVWVAANVTILSGVTIGDGAVIGANSLVSKDVPPYCIAAGVPARVIKKRFSDEVIAELEDIKWWDLPLDIIETHVPLLQSANIEEFITQIKKATSKK